MRTITEKIFTDEYLIHKELSQDKQYKTFTAMRERSNGEPFMIVLKELDEKRAAVYEALTGMWNPYIADTYDIFKVVNTDNPEKHRYIAVTEYVYAVGCPYEETMSLSQFVKRNGTLSKKTALSVCIQLCKGLAEFHRKGFVHRDLKPDNIMISQYNHDTPQIKIVDFGGAKPVNINSLSDTTVVGTLGYQAPESLSSVTTNRADIYSIGCILNFMLTGQEPGLVRYKEDHYIAAIIEKAANEDSSHRYASVTALQKALEHESGIGRIDRTPILRTLPGFRTHTIWKELIASLSYISMILVAVISFNLFGIVGIFEIFFFYVIVPLIVIFNMGNLLRFVPGSIRRSNQQFLILRVAILLFSVFAPIVVDTLLGRT